MDLTTNKDSTFFASQVGATLDGNNGFCNKSAKNPFLDTFADPLCKLNLKETSEFVKSFPVSNNGAENRGLLEISTQRSTENGANSVTRRNVEPPTPGRPIFSFSNGNFTRKNFPSKWDDAEKWVVSGHDSPAHNHGLLKPMFSRQCSGYKSHLGTEKSKVNEEKVSKVLSTFQGSLVLDHHNSAKTINGVSVSSSEDALLKDKFPNQCSELMQEGFLFGNIVEKSLNGKMSRMVVNEVKHKDVGTEMTPLGSSTTSRCPTPFISTSPARHNTPSNRSGPLESGSIDSSNTMDITQLQECHLAKMHVGFDSVTSNWSSREEEEEDVSKSLRHFEMSSECRKSVHESRSCTWEEEEKTKSCLRYQREEAKIKAWVNHQSAKAEAESTKLEVKIQKMRSHLEEKLMKRMADVQRKAVEWRASAQFQHSEQARKMVMNKNNSSHYKSCGCFPCTTRRI